MKKYILMLFAFVAAFTSCTNDDITISYATNFKINPATVIAPFTWEWEAGDLESFDTSYQLRIRLLIYNTEGLLQAEDTQYFSNYSVVMNSAISLPEGSYVAVAITDVIAKSSSASVPEYWVLSDYQKLADTHIDDAGYIGGKYKILGITKSDFSVNEATQDDIFINVQPTGSLFFVWFQNIHTYSDVTRYTLSCAKSAESCLFSSDGSYSIASENNNGSYDWRIAYIEVANYQYSGVYGYYYVLPTSNLNLKFQYNTSSTSNNDITPVMTVNPKAGEEYLFTLNMKDEDMNDGISYYYGLMNGTTTKSVLQQVNSINLENNAEVEPSRIYLKDIK